MKRSVITQTLGLAAMLAGLPVLSLLADDLHPPSPSEPATVWQGNRVPGPGAEAEPQAAVMGGINYITGGVGSEERNALEAVKHDYDLHITSTDRDGNYQGDSRVIILDRRGQQLLNVSTGPIFYANLPHGTYTVEVSTAGEVKKRTVAVRDQKPLSLYFRE